MKPIGDLKRLAKEKLNGNFGTCILIEIISGLLTGLSSLIPFGALVVKGPFDVGSQHIYNRVTDRCRPEVKELFTGFAQNFGENFLVGLLKTIYLLLWTMLCIIPGIIKAYSYSMAEYLMARNTDMSASDAIRESRYLMNGHKMELFELDLSFIGWDILTVITCGLLSLYVVPYKNATKTEFFNEIYYSSN